MKYRVYLTCLFLLASALSAKTTKVNVRAKVDSSTTREKAQGSLSIAVASPLITYVNVTLSSEDASAVANNNGQWCIQSQDEAVNLQKGGEYQGVLDGDFVELVIPLKNGKMRKISFKIFDHKWHTPYDLPGGPAA